MDLIERIKKAKVLAAERIIVDDLKELGISTGDEKETGGHTIWQKTPYSFFVTCADNNERVELGKMPKHCPTCGEKL